MNDIAVSELAEQNESAEGPEEIEEYQEDEPASIGAVINCFLHRVLDIEHCAQEFIAQAASNYNENALRISKAIAQCQDIIQSNCEPDNSSAAVRELRKLMREIERHNNSSPVATLEKSLFVSLFASFDKFVGDLVIAIYSSTPLLYKNINREISLSEVLKFDSMESLKQFMLDKEVETLRRKSYIEQFKELENKFSITLTKFDKWPDFVECSQRRNLFTHCDGIISKQYIDICTEHNVKFEEKPIIGQQLYLGGKYFFNACRIVTDVAVMLGHTLWRKTNPEDIKEADSHLNSLIFDFLHMENWKKAISLSKFALNLPKHSEEQMVRMFHVNYAIALKSIGQAKAAKGVLDKKDWSAASFDFRLAYAVLSDEFEAAKTLMQRIGPKGDLVTEMAYHDWPLFREFRETKEFSEGYEDVYGYRYATKLTLLALDQSADVIEAEVTNPDDSEQQAQREEVL